MCGSQCTARARRGKAGRVQTAKPPTGNIRNIYFTLLVWFLAKPKQSIDKLREGNSVPSAQSHVCLFVYYAGCKATPGINRKAPFHPMWCHTEGCRRDQELWFSFKQHKVTHSQYLPINIFHQGSDREASICVYLTDCQLVIVRVTSTSSFCLGLSNVYNAYQVLKGRKTICSWHVSYCPVPHLGHEVNSWHYWLSPQIGFLLGKLSKTT